MGRLGMLYAITANELKELKLQPQDTMYDFMLENIEDKYISTSRACELDKAWEGIHFCLNDGEWVEDNSTEATVIFCGNFLLDYADHVITHKDPSMIKAIIDYLNLIDIRTVIKNGFEKINPENYSLPKDGDNLEFLLGWSEDIKDFYENTQKNDLHVIFTVDL